MSWYTSSKLWCFVGGAAAATLVNFAAKQPAVREAAVTVLAKGIEVQQSANENIQSIKEDAEDMAAEARDQARAEAAEADYRAEIEARIREEVEAEIAAQKEAAQKPAPAKKPTAKRATRSSSKK